MTGSRRCTLPTAILLGVALALVAPASAQRAPQDRPDLPLDAYVESDGSVRARTVADPSFPYAHLVERVDDDSGVRYVVPGWVPDGAALAPGEWSGLGAGLLDLARGEIYAVAAGPADTVYVAGRFSELDDGTAAANVAVWTGTRWEALGQGLDGFGVEALAIDGSGALVAGGYFEDADRGLYNVARWDGTAWTGLGTGMNGSVQDLDVAPDGTIYAIGCFSRSGDNAVDLNQLASWDGVAWSPVGGGLISGCNYEVALGAAGEVYASGFFSGTVDGTVTGRPYIAKWDGTEWSTLGPGLNGPANGLEVDAAGGLYAGGVDATGDGATDLKGVGYWDGTSWSAVGLGLGFAGYLVRDLALSADGTLYAAGWFNFTDDGSVYVRRLAAWDGAAWTPVGGGVEQGAEALAFRPDGALLVAGGQMTSVDGFDVPAAGVAAWDGVGWRTYDPFNPFIQRRAARVVAVVPDGSGGAYVGGTFDATSDQSQTLTNVAHWTGSTWEPLGVGFGERFVTQVADLSLVDGTVHVVGYPYSGFHTWDGSSWSPTGTDLGGDIRTIEPDGSGGVYVGGARLNIGADGPHTAVHWDGAAWSPLGTGVDGAVDTILPMPDGTLVAGGFFPLAGDGSTVLNHVATWDGTTWGAVGTGLDQRVRSLTLTSDGDLVAGGWFRTSGDGATDLKSVARWDGTAWVPIGVGIGARPPGNDAVFALAAGPGGRIYAGGQFYGPGDGTTGGLRSILQWDGSEWGSVGGGLLFGSVHALALDSEGDLLAGGDFTGTEDGTVPLLGIGKYDVIPSGPPIAIADARALGPGNTVTVQGTVTRAFGDFTYIQDGTAGLSIRQTSGAFHDAVQDNSISPGTTLDITGTLSEFAGLLQINEGSLASFSITGSTAVPEAQLVTLAEIEANGEAHESELLRVVSVTFEDGGTFESRTNYAIADPGSPTSPVILRIPNSGDTEVDGLPIPTGPTTITSVLGQFDPVSPNTGYQLLPILETDVEASGPPTGPSIVISGERGVRYLGPPAEGITIDHLAAQNLVRGVPGFYEANPNPTLWTEYDAVSGEWLATHGAGFELPLAKAFRWYFLDRDGVGDPAVSESVALPFTLSTDVAPNNRQVRLALDTSGNRFNHLANPFGVDIDLSGIRDWQGGAGLSRNSDVYTYDATTGSWGPATSAAPWEAFRFRARGPRRNGSPRNLTIPVTAQAPSADRAAPPTRPQVAFTLTATSETGRPLADRMLTVAFDGVSAAFDMDEDVEKFQPPTTAYAMIGARVGSEILGHDARPFADAEIPLALEARGARAEMTLSWDAATLPAGLPVALIDLATGDEIDVRTRSRYDFRASTRPALADIPTSDLADADAAADRFVLRIGSALASADDVSAVALSAPVPNPSAGRARVSFAVPSTGPARLAVFDARGRRVAVLADGTVEAGRHDVELPSSLAAGVYVLRLEAAGAVVTGRAVVVR